MIGTTTYIVDAHATARHEALIAEANRRHARDHAAVARPPGPIRRQLGALLVSAGQRLHGPTQAPAAEGAC
ncbi:MAG: hypothetical protein AVDCRST_MAG73-405 [uncultured Thermomicrobiales bacterium]|uniref:Uncharacterized protein n=1 Tax=uncultured Thermomicrobiales bacterium TaxID=1645740 RepID=A0A6J4TK89_9BACT|nr:MAG: hypothetical protein AVDCRST_MAG73-405 [uncultured Thermomicrobiales bacterium]